MGAARQHGADAHHQQGLAALAGEILTWLNSDDTLLPGAVTKAVEYLQAHPDCGIVFGDTLFTEPDGSPIERSKARTGFDYREFVLVCENPIPQPSAFIRRSVVDDVGLLDPHYYYFMDWDFFLRAGVRHRIEYTPELLSTYRLHPESKTVAQAARAAPELEVMYRNYFALAGRAGRNPAREGARDGEHVLHERRLLHQGRRPRGRRARGFEGAAHAPGRAPRPGMLHKFLYCLSGERRAYREGRELYRRTRAAFARH